MIYTAWSSSRMAFKAPRAVVSPFRTFSQEIFHATNPDAIPSPSLLISKSRVGHNLDRMLQIAGGRPECLRPHVKTHKMKEIVKMQLDRGITKVKCATIAEMEMCASSGCSSVMMAYQPVGPNIERLSRLVEAFPETEFSAVVDASSAVEGISRVCQQSLQATRPLTLLVDVNCGMNRTGVSIDGVLDVVNAVRDAEGVVFGGLHAYDGHLTDSSQDVRKERYSTSFEPLWSVIDKLKDSSDGFVLVTSGSPTMAIHGEKSKNVDFPYEISAGTTVLWDAGYEKLFPELGFTWAAILLVRVISKPTPTTICVDLGHKAVASENPIGNRVVFPDIPDAQFVTQSEEHLLIETGRARALQIGQVLYGIPVHVCPTVALYDEAFVVDDSGLVEEQWAISARARRITF